MYRGRTIHRFVAVLRRFDAATTDTGSGFDPDFRIVLPGKRVELSAERIRCQIDRSSWGRETITLSGREIHADLILTLEWRDLQAASLVDATTGRPLLAAGDRIEQIERRDGTLEEAFPNPPGMFIEGTERVTGIGAFSVPRTNLLYAFCSFAKKGQR